MRNRIVSAVAVVACVTVVQGQGRPAFEVASIRVNKSDAGKRGISTSPGGRFNAYSASLGMLIQFAYRLQSYQVTGGPDWADVDRFDIAAKGDETDMQLMLQALLADRFKLVVRSESRELPIYTLVVKSDGKLGETLHRSAIDCSGPTAPSACGIRMGLGKITAGGASMAQLASTLSGLLTRTVVDRTNLAGTYDATLAWTPDQATPGMALKAGYAPQAVDPNGPSIFTAVQEQLGLKLESSKGPVTVLVVVSAQRPTEN